MLSSQQTLYPSMRFISSCMTELVSSTERRTFTAAYKELSSGAIATRPRTRAGPPTYRKPLDALLGVNVRTPTREQQQAQKHTAKKKGVQNCFGFSWIYQNVQSVLLQLCELCRSGAGWYYEQEIQAWSYHETLFPSERQHYFQLLLNNTLINGCKV